VQYKASLDQYDKNKIMYMARIEAHCPAHPYAKVARYFQLRLVSWFRNMQTSSVLLPPPAFEVLLRKVEVDDPTWSPTIPVAYIRAPPRTTAAAPTSRQPNAATIDPRRSTPGGGSCSACVIVSSCAEPRSDPAGYHCRVWRTHRQHHAHDRHCTRRPLA
jgi:hypothetical protein